MFLFHLLFKPEHSCWELRIVALKLIRREIARMMLVEILHNMESAAVDVEMDIPCFKVGRERFPDRYLRMQCLYRAPCGIAYSFAVDFRLYEQQFKVAVSA